MDTMENSNLKAQLDELIGARCMSENAAVGAAFLLNGELAASYSRGTLDGGEASPAVNEDTLFNIGSVSKVYCAMAVMKLVELGLADLDTPVCEYLPRFTMRDGRYRKITLRMCLRYTSGLPGTCMNRLFGTKWLGEGYYDEVYRYFENSILKAEPGSYSVYCNDGYILAEMVVATRSGQSYTAFLQQHITGPAGAASACTGASDIPEGRRVRQAGRPQETLSALGSGGVISTLADCARVGSLFIDPRGVLRQESIDEIASPQGVTFLRDEVTSSFGYGWDSVAFRHPLLDLGGGALMKSGGTLQFSTYLLVCPALGLSAAMSATMDSAMEVLGALCDAAALVLRAKGVAVPAKQPPEPQELPLPEGFAAAHEGMYHNFMGAYKVSFPEGKLALETYADGTMQPMIPGAVFDGEWFNFGPLSFGFQQHGGRVYLMQKSLIGCTAFGERFGWENPVPEVWQARVGKKYIATGFAPADAGIGLMYGGLRIDALAGTNLLLFCTKAPFLPFGTLPVAFEGEEARMPLNAPGGAGSRDQFAPVAFTEAGVEYIYDRGYTYRDAATLPPLVAGTVALEAGTALYSLPEGCEVKLAATGDVRAVCLSSRLDILYDGPAEGLATAGGYLVLACEAAASVEVALERADG